jgi:hypothetical protein
MHLLFEDRLGHTVYSPRGGKDWEKLRITQPPHNGMFFDKAYFENDIKHIHVPRDSYNIKLLTVDQFMEMDFGLIIVGNGYSEIPFLNLAKQYKPKTPFVRQIANLLEVPKACKNVMLSTKTPMPPKVIWTKHLMEQPRAFQYVPFDGPKKTVKSYSNFLRQNKVDAGTWDQVKSMMPAFDFKMHGAKNDDKWIRQDLLYKSMQEAMFIWHTKAAGGGGFTAQEALASGRPLIVKKHYAITQKTRAQDYLVDGVNCVDLSVRSVPEAVGIIRKWSEKGMYEKKCRDVLKHFNKHFNFEQNAKSIDKWIEGLQPGV